MAFFSFITAIVFNFYYYWVKHPNLKAPVTSQMNPKCNQILRLEDSHMTVKCLDLVSYNGFQW